MEKKLAYILDACKHENLKWSDVIFHMSSLPSAAEKSLWNAQDAKSFLSRFAILRNFFQGKTSHSVGHILDVWIRHPYGRIHKDSPEMLSQLQLS